MLSIVIPTYNYDCTPLLKWLINSGTLERTLEIVVCDDASTNKLISRTIEEYCNTHSIQFIKNLTNKGRTATRTTLARNAKNDWLLFLDADVIPVNSDFLDIYLQYISDLNTMYVGGIAYKEKQKNTSNALRWKFGVERESRLAKDRNKNPYLLASANLLVRKDIFSKANTTNSTRYGLDALFGYNLKKLHIPVKHIDNPVYHIGLESNDVFLKKSLNALETIIQLEKEGLLPPDHTRLQKKYTSLKGKPVIRSLIGLFQKHIEKNLLGKNPSLFLFDIYRLYHYIKLKSNA